MQRRASRSRFWTLAVCVLSIWTTFRPGAQETRDRILVLVSIDGWRADYLDRMEAPAVRALAARGVRAQGLTPSMPAYTFPNHYTIVTGLYPEHHGIVSNNIADPAFAERFSLSAPTAKDARWWGGEPIWVTAVRQGQRSAAMFWPGSEVEIGGVRPTYWRPFDDSVPNADRVRQVLDWLALPPAERPSFVTLYFSELDHVGHDDGPDSPKMPEAVRHVDAAVAALVAGIESLRLLDRTTLVIVSDHGMSQLSDSRVIFLDDYVDPASVNVVDWSPMLALSPRTGSVDEVYRALRGRHPALAVYKRDETPAELHYRNNPRIQPIIALADDGWLVTTHARFESSKTSGRRSWGAHGYDPRLPSMGALFVAAGPSLRPGLVVPSFQNIHLYEFMCRVLGLRPAPNDGDPGVTRAFFR